MARKNAGPRVSLKRSPYSCANTGANARRTQNTTGTLKTPNGNRMIASLLHTLVVASASFLPYLTMLQMGTSPAERRDAQPHRKSARARAESEHCSVGRRIGAEWGLATQHRQGRARPESGHPRQHSCCACRPTHCCVFTVCAAHGPSLSAPPCKAPAQHGAQSGAEETDTSPTEVALHADMPISMPPRTSGDVVSTCFGSRKLARLKSPSSRPMDDRPGPPCVVPSCHGALHKAEPGRGQSRQLA